MQGMEEQSVATSTLVHLAALSAVLLERLDHPDAADLATSRLREELEMLHESATAKARSAAQGGRR